MKIPKCTKAITGEHKWITEKWGVVGMKEEKHEGYFGIGNTSITMPKYGTLKITPYCKYCGMIDDRQKAVKSELNK
jgi:hypothetical protein